jgi:hypothetical protein
MIHITKTISAMSTAELKIDLISRIANTEEPRIIEELRKLLDFELDKEAYELNTRQHQRVSEAKAEYLAGNVLSEQQADEAIDQWLSEK